MRPPTASDQPVSPTPATAPGLRHLVIAGGSAMVLSQVAMVAIMTMTPVYMRHHHHTLSDVGFIISLHIAAMFLPSPLTGVLVDRVGRMPMVIASAVTLLAAGMVAAFVPGDSMTLMAVALVLLGLGWNFGLISGTALIVDGTQPETRARTQGAIDVLVALAGAGGSVLSGWIVAGTDFATLAIGGGIVALFLVPVVAWSVTESRRPKG